MGSEKIKVAIGIYNERERKKFREAVSAQNDMELSGEAANGGELLFLAENQKPDILIFELFLPFVDGFGILETSAEKSLNISSIVLSTADREDLVTKALSLGAGYCMIKPYNCELLLKRIRELCGKPGFAENFEKKAASNGADMEKNIAIFLNSMGINASIKGYHYLKTAVSMAAKDQDAMVGITKRLYPDVAKVHQTTSGKVERAIRHAVESSWKRGGSKVYCKMTGCYFGDKPTNGQFIGTIAECLRLGLRGR